jgi:hypothetical protein
MFADLRRTQDRELPRHVPARLLDHLGVDGRGRLGYRYSA